MQLYTSWLQQVSPGATPTFFGVFSWSAARLFVEKAAALGGRLTRASLVDALAKTDNWTANGMTRPQHVGTKRTGDCWRFIQLSGGSWKPVGGPSTPAPARPRAEEQTVASFIAYTLYGLFSGAAYAIAASGLVLTYATTRVFNVAHGALGMLLSFVFWDFSVRQGLPRGWPCCWSSSWWRRRSAGSSPGSWPAASVTRPRASPWS